MFDDFVVCFEVECWLVGECVVCVCDCMVDVGCWCVVVLLGYSVGVWVVWSEDGVWVCDLGVVDEEFCYDLFIFVWFWVVVCGLDCWFLCWVWWYCWLIVWMSCLWLCLVWCWCGSCWVMCLIWVIWEYCFVCWVYWLWLVWWCFCVLCVGCWCGIWVWGLCWRCWCDFGNVVFLFWVFCGLVVYCGVWGWLCFVCFVVVGWCILGNVVLVLWGMICGCVSWGNWLCWNWFGRSVNWLYVRMVMCCFCWSGCVVLCRCVLESGCGIVWWIWSVSVIVSCWCCLCDSVGLGIVSIFLCSLLGCVRCLVLIFVFICWVFGLYVWLCLCGSCRMVVWGWFVFWFCICLWCCLFLIFLLWRSSWFCLVWFCFWVCGVSVWCVWWVCCGWVWMWLGLVWFFVWVIWVCWCCLFVWFEWWLCCVFF